MNDQEDNENDDDDDNHGLTLAAHRSDWDDDLVDDDPDAEFLEPPQSLDYEEEEESFQPSEALANRLGFFTLAQRLEHVSKAGRRGEGPTKLERLAYLLPPQLLAQFQCRPTDSHQQPESIYPLLRLLLPAKDGHRGNYNVKEARLAQAYSQAYDLPTRSRTMLLHWHDPVVCSHQDGVGEFARVLETVLQRRINSNKVFHQKFREDPSKGFTVGQVNELLDELAGLSAKAQAMNERAATRSGEAATTKTTAQKLLVAWVQSLNPYMGNSDVWGLSPLEHKWLNRIILTGSLKIGFGENTILEWYSRLGRSLWDAHNSLKAVCTKLVNPAFVNSLRQPKELASNQNIGLHNYMTLPAQPIAFGVPFVPMCAAKTTMDRTLEILSSPHRNFDDYLEDNLPCKHALALRNPAFTIETKLDGERQVVHFSRDGVVKIQSRRSNWFSDLYSPVLGPPLRRALEKHGFDIILDGEILAYCGEKQGNQFGLNRTVAKKRRDWLEAEGLLDDRDREIHAQDKEYKSMSLSSPVFNATELEDSVTGENVWLTYVVFDVLYVDGPRAAEFLDETVTKCISPRPSSGSLISLSAMERKKILYRLVSTQDKMIEIVDTQVVRPNGELISGVHYFDKDNPYLDPDSGFPASTIDSLDCCFGIYPKNYFEIDAAKRKAATEEKPSQERALKCDMMYRQTVDEFCLEGLVFKSLGSAYILGEQSRALRYWLKLKPDYSDGSLVSDLDLVIVGGYFASGLAKAGTPSSFLVACRDSMNPGYYMPFCKINAGVKGEVYKDFYERTGCREYNGGSNEIGQCMWFCSKTEPPDFISNRSFQRSWYQSDFNGWKWDKPNYPHIWIRPENSAIVTVKAGEIIQASTFPPGVTLRHPRIDAFRNQDSGDEKDLSTIECEKQLRELYQQYAESRSKTFNSNLFSKGIPRGINTSQPCLFLTESQFAAKSRKKVTRRERKPKRQLMMATVDEPASRALADLTFCVLPGVYNLALSQTDRDLAKEDGWFSEAEPVSSELDVATFIKSHGGTVKLTTDADTLVLGGLRTDHKVQSHILGINQALDFLASTKPSSQGKPKSTALRCKAQERGVVRWTFVYSALYKWKQSTPDLDSSMMETRPDLLEPHILDYIARPRESCDDELDQLCRLDLEQEIQLRRALDAVDMHCRQLSKRPRTTWQKLVRELSEEERRAMLPWKEAERTMGSMVLYADVFRSDEDLHVLFEPDVDLDGILWTADTTGQLQDRLRTNVDHVLAVLPLARTMGALVTHRLSPKVTHIVCDIADTAVEPAEWSLSMAKASGLSLRETRKALLDQIQALERAQGVSIKLISPKYISQHWQECQWNV